MAKTNMTLFSLITLPSSGEVVEALPVIFSLFVIEGLLSVDNAIAIAAMAKHLPKNQQKLALKFGMLGAYFFRGLCLWGAAWIIANPWLKIAGAAFLVHLMSSHFAKADDTDDGDENESKNATRGFLLTVLAIELMDLSLSVDNVVAAVAISPKLWVVCAGVFMGILALRFVAGLCIKLIEFFPILEDAAFMLIGFVGFILVAEIAWHVEISPLQKFAGIATILGLALIYERFGFLRLICKPFFSLIKWPMKIYSWVVGGFLTILGYPFAFVFNLFRNKKADASDVFASK